jgi:hypothetical protein
VLAENLANLLGKTLVGPRRRLLAPILRFWLLPSRCLFLSAHRASKAVPDRSRIQDRTVMELPTEPKARGGRAPEALGRNAGYRDVTTTPLANSPESIVNFNI